ncbi:acetate--CoA ligase family protein [Schlesneria paludicola]|uniref:acetate--CoA ligase family protein n=1 Tax=Schlesneria paludicola TaxID=360056 RepID=UPI00029B3B65|nr:acetate--CoA ligase family protein [Schlesneria paludicola]
MRDDGLQAIFAPKSIAVVGASDKPGSVGGALFANLKATGYQGELFAINSKHLLVQGERAYESLAKLPRVPDLVVVCTPASTVPCLVQECGRLGTRGMIVISAGFREAGADGRRIESELVAAAREFPLLRFIGPNCLGVLRPVHKLNASFSPVMPHPGRIAFLSQSGALCTAILDWSAERELGFSACVSVGNMTNVGMGDLIDYFAEDQQTDAILLYLEGLDQASHFLSAARKCARHKPVIVCKSGRFAESALAAVSHTGAIASADAVCDIAFRHAGIERVDTIEELFDCASLLIAHGAPEGDRLAIVTNAGGPGVMASDAWLALGHPLSRLSEESIESLNRVLPSCWSHRNPVDVLGDAGCARFQAAIQIVAQDPNVDALLVILTPQTMTDPERIAESIVVARANGTKPIVVAFIGGAAVTTGRTILRRAGVPNYDFPEEAVRALSHVTALRRKQCAATSFDSVNTSATPESLRRLGRAVTSEQIAFWRAELAEKQGLLDERKSKSLLADFGIQVVQGRLAASADAAEEIAEQTGYPVVLKVLSPDISHKTDVGGVMLNIPNAQSVREAFATMMKVVRERSPSARIEGVSVQPMVSIARGVELILGMTRDPQLGPVVVIGAGGITAELQRDTAMELPPCDEQTADRMLRSLRLYPILEGYRQRPGVDLVQLKLTMKRFFQLVEDLPELSMVEINPLLATATTCIALDGRMSVG